MQKIIFILTFSLMIPLAGSAQENYLTIRMNYFFPVQKNNFYPSVSLRSMSLVLDRFQFSPFPVFNSSVYRNFESYRFQFPQGAVFCRMEEKSVKRFNVMFSLHAGVYSEK